MICGRDQDGLSPRVRGNLLNAALVCLGLRSIPACAGEPAAAAAVIGMIPVYPRVCGGTAPAHSAMARGRGLSPRVRGNHHGVAAGQVAAGSIPACAGEPAGGKPP